MKSLKPEDQPYLKHWFKNISEEQIKKMDEEARTFYTEFMPLYKTYVGTNQLLKHIRDYLKNHVIKRKEDFQIQLTCMWIDHIHFYRDKKEINFKAEDIFKIKIPKEIKSLIYKEIE